MTTLADIRDITEDVFGIDHGALKGYSRERHLVRGRRAFIQVAREQGTFSLPQIGKAIKRDHTTVMFHLREAAKGRLVDEESLRAIKCRLSPPYIKSSDPYRFKSVRRPTCS